MRARDIESRIATLEDRLDARQPELVVTIVQFVCPGDDERDPPRTLLGYGHGEEFSPRDPGESEEECRERVKSILLRDRLRLGQTALLLLEKREEPERYHRTGEDPQRLYRTADLDGLKPAPLSGKPIKFVVPASPS